MVRAFGRWGQQAVAGAATAESLPPAPRAALFLQAARKAQSSAGEVPNTGRFPAARRAMATILCVDDEAAVGVVLEHTLAKLGHTPLLAGSVPEAVAAVGRGDIDLIIADYVMPGSTGLDLLQLLAEQGHRIPVIIMTGYSSIESAVASIKSGAIDYLPKPIRPETLEIAVNQALEVIRLRRENESFRSEIRQ